MMRILVANRGEIARRIIRTARLLGHETVAAFADPDRDAPFVSEATVAARLGPAALAESYLSADRLLTVARETGATAVHPGYGFLSENARFAQAVGDAGLVWVGPHPDAIAQMGSKIEARGLARRAGVPTIPGFDESQEPDDLAAAAERIGYPVLVKAAAGGGGKGIRIIREADGFRAALEEAAAEAERSFGDPAMIVERYIERARHVEVQVVGDRHGNVVDLGTRECSVQRRYQKVLEEAPAPNLEDGTRDGLCQTARELARSIGYDSTGTVEYVVDDDTGEFFFLEMNTRLQVEHPVTEAVTGLDLVALQLRCAAGEVLPIAQGDISFSGHAFEARINAEDALHGFAPQIGKIRELRVPDGVRWDSGIESGSEITPHYDAMVAKMIVHAGDRAAARRALAAALDELLVGGLVTNAGFHRWLLEQESVVEGRVTTSFLDGADLPEDDGQAAAAQVAGELWRHVSAAAAVEGPWRGTGEFRVTPHESTLPLFLQGRGGAVFEVGPAPSVRYDGQHVFRRDGDVWKRYAAAADVEGRSVCINVDGASHRFEVVGRSQHWAPAADEGGDAAQSIRAPFPAVVTETPVAVGDRVAAGDTVVVIEAMKMLHSLTAKGAGVVREVHVAVGDAVESNQVLVGFESGDESPASE